MRNRNNRLSYYAREPLRIGSIPPTSLWLLVSVLEKFPGNLDFVSIVETGVGQLFHIGWDRYH